MPSRLLTKRSPTSPPVLGQRIWSALERREVQTLDQVLQAPKQKILAAVRHLVETGRNPLIFSTFGRQHEAMRLLLPFCDPKSKNDEGDTALLVAAQALDATAIDILLPVSDTSTMGFERQTPLMLVARRGDVECLQRLLPHSNPTLQSPIGNTALMCAAVGRNAECVQLLAPVSDPLAQQPHTGANALMLALHRFSPLEIIHRLVALSDLQQCDALGSTALFYAASANRACLEVLLPLCDPGTLNHEGETPLFFAARNADPEPLRTLLPLLSADAHSHRNRRGDTALHCAVRQNCPLNAKILASLGDPLALNAEQLDAFSMAMNHHLFDTADVLTPYLPPHRVPQAYAQFLREQEAGQSMPFLQARVERLILEDNLNQHSSPDSSTRSLHSPQDESPIAHPHADSLEKETRRPPSSHRHFRI